MVQNVTEPITSIKVFKDKFLRKLTFRNNLFTYFYFTSCRCMQFKNFQDAQINLLTKILKKITPFNRTSLIKI